MSEPNAAQYDVFISYKSEYLAWVEALARNVERQGLTVWLDHWRRVPGNPVASSLERALHASRAGILVVTPEAAQSGWVQSEYEQMRARQRRGDGFRLIPLILQASEGFAFVGELFAVDFRAASTAGLYRRRLHEVVCGVRGEPPGPSIALQGEIELPPTVDPAERAADTGAFRALLDDVQRHRVAAVFAQEGAQHLTTIEQLIEAATARFQGWRVSHLTPLVCEEDRAADYFAHAARRCGLAGEIADAAAFGRALEDEFSRGARRLVIVSHIENGPDAARRALATQLRRLLESHPEALRLLFVGGEKLDELVFHASQTLSVLSNAAATAHDWPAPGLAEMRALLRGEEIGAEEAALLLELTGGEPRLLAECLRRRARMPLRSAAAYAAVIHDCPTTWQWFAPIVTEAEARRRACALLAEADLGPFGRIRDNELLRKLYWRGALRKVVPEGLDRLAWCGAAVRARGREMLSCAP